MITRIPRDAEHPFAMIPRSIISNSTLSLEAFRVLVTVLDQRNDWDGNTVWLQQITGMSQRKVERALVELINLGYMSCTPKAPEGAGDDKTPRGGGLSAALAKGVFRS